MFNKYIRYFNQNKSKVIMIVIAVILAFILIQALNQFIEDENKSRINELTNTVIIDKEIKDSVIKEGSTSTEVAKKSKSMIDEFVKYCNTKNTKKAYELLSQDCKDILFPTEEDFINTYYNLVFNSYKEYEIENWVSNGNYITYKIRYTNDALAQGGYKSEYTLEDYYISKPDGIERIKCVLNDWDLKARKTIIIELMKRLEKTGIMITISNLIKLVELI